MAQEEPIDLPQANRILRALFLLTESQLELVATYMVETVTAMTITLERRRGLNPRHVSKTLLETVPRGSMTRAVMQILLGEEGDPGSQPGAPGPRPGPDGDRPSGNGQR